MGNLIETITNTFHGKTKGCVNQIEIYDDKVKVTRLQMDDVTYEYKDFAKVGLQPASIYCAFGMIVFLEKDYHTVNMIHGYPPTPEPNRIYFIGGTFSYAKVNIFMDELTKKLNQAIKNFKSGAVGQAQTKIVDAKSETDIIEALKQYKELLDSGVITQEEFDTKKKELLGSKTATNVPQTAEPVQVKEDVVCCPKCGSTEFHHGKRGWNIFTGLIGSGKIVMTCLKCGNKWTVEDYKK